jgi:GNAT superfamily N-acetyltransferase
MLPSAKRGNNAPLDLADISVVPLTNAIVVNNFDCGAAPLNKFLKNRAAKMGKRFEMCAFAAVLDGSPNCVGFYALQIGSDTIPETFKKNRQDYIANYAAFPAVHLSYFAVHKDYQRKKLGRFLFMDLLEKVAAVSENVGFYALTLQSFDAKSTAFYKALEFEEYSEGCGQPKMLYPLVNILKLLGKL